MFDVPLVVNRILTDLLSTVDPDKDYEPTYSFLPSTAYVTLISVLPYLDFPPTLVDYLQLDVDSVFQDPDDCQCFLENIPSLVRIEKDSTIESYIKIYVHKSDEGDSDPKHPISTLFDIEFEKIHTYERQIVSILLHEWSKLKLKTHDLRLVQMQQQTPKTDFITVANTMYISSKWRYPFVETCNRMSRFHIDCDYNIQIEMMKVQQEFRHCVHPDLDIACVELPLEDCDLSVLIFHPAKKHVDLNCILRKIDTLFLDDCFSMFTQSEVCVELPKFKINDHINIFDHFRRLDLFKKLPTSVVAYQISDITQSVFLTVNEYGISTKHSPAQSAKMETSRLSVRVPRHKINGPFVFMVYNARYRCPIFVSAVYYPSRK